MSDSLHESYIRLVYGPKKRSKKKFKQREARLTDSVERVLVPFPQRRKYFHTPKPDICRSVSATRHDRDAVKQLIRQKKKPKPLFLRVSKVKLTPR